MERILEAAAGNKNYRQEGIEFLLKRDRNVLIIEEIVKTVTRNKKGRDVIEVLLKRNPNILIIEGIAWAVILSKSRKTATKLLQS